jgi:hypothetical protein
LKTLRFPALARSSGGSPNRHPTTISLGNASIPLVGGLFVIALASRVVASFILPNAEQDGYSYAETIGQLTEHFRAGQFHLSDLYGFWLPLFQIVAAALNFWTHDPILSGKVINALCGAVSLVLVFLITRVVTRSLFFSSVAFCVILLDPLHLLYSAACMTDVPHSCLVLASLWYALHRRWLVAAVFGALAGCIRIEAWALVAALPLLQLIYERRISLLVTGILLLPPLGWLFISYAATGHPLSYFTERARYHVEYMRFHPERHGFDWGVINNDVTYFLLGAGKTVCLGAMAAAVVIFFKWARDRKLPDERLLTPIIFGGGTLGLLVLAYVTKAQPVLLPRYGLLFLVVGLPLFAWALQQCLKRTEASLVKGAILLGVSAACLTEMHKQLPTLWKVRDDFRAHQQIAGALVADFEQSPPESRCFSDDVAIRVLSGLPRQRFLRSAFVPPSAKNNRGDFLTWLRLQRAAYLIFFPTEDSIPLNVFPELSSANSSNGSFELISFAHSSFGPDVWLYRLR